MVIEYKSLGIGLLGGIIVGIFVSILTRGTPPNLGDVVERTHARVGVVVSGEGKLVVAKPDGTGIPECNGRKGQEKCRAKFAQDDKGNTIIVDTQTGEPLEQIFPVQTILYGAYKGSHCPLICGAAGCFDPCSYF